ncbi:putative signal peptide protein [Fimbriiglobus ruber]|uniref:Putative signal peptide protein n=1 Tax=Fimbriiglobus ruber TaxID=1908690 RepID=A0A225DSD0_9BACT|nr:putative signal peptide protein [Fimbriiglobus ruber]
MPDAPNVHRFPLSAADVKDTNEAPTLAADAAGRVFLAWASKTGDRERTVFFTRTTDSGRMFDAPHTISKGGIYRSRSSENGKIVGYERRAVPHLATAADRLELSWSEAPADGSGITLRLATSADAGRTFAAPVSVPHLDGMRTTFTDMASGPNGALACCWLGDRNGAQQPYAAVRPAGATAFETEQVVYLGQNGKGVCPCCPTAVGFAPDGTLYVAYRNVNDGYRDIAIGRLRPGQTAFEGPFSVVSNTWKFDGCPHDGPSLVVIGDDIHVTWMDARNGPQRAYHARAKCADMIFSARELNPAGPGTQGNARLFKDAAGGLHVVWEESLGAESTADEHSGHRHAPVVPKPGAGGGRAIQYATMAPGATAFGQPRAVAPRAGAFQTRPALVTTSDGSVFVAWNELDESGKVVVVTRLARGVNP